MDGDREVRVLRLKRGLHERGLGEGEGGASRADVEGGGGGGGGRGRGRGPGRGRGRGVGGHCGVGGRKAGGLVVFYGVVLCRGGVRRAGRFFGGWGGGRKELGKKK